MILLFDKLKISFDAAEFCSIDRRVVENNFEFLFGQFFPIFRIEINDFRYWFEFFFLIFDC
jgi:hypothetical protein